MEVSVCVTLSVLQRRDLEISMTQGMKMDAQGEMWGLWSQAEKETQARLCQCFDLRTQLGS